MALDVSRNAKRCKQSAHHQQNHSHRPEHNRHIGANLVRRFGRNEPRAKQQNQKQACEGIKHPLTDGLFEAQFCDGENPPETQPGKVHQKRQRDCQDRCQGAKRQNIIDPFRPHHRGYGGGSGLFRIIIRPQRLGELGQAENVQTHHGK